MVHILDYAVVTAESVTCQFVHLWRIGELVNLPIYTSWIQRSLVHIQWTVWPTVKTCPKASYSSEALECYSSAQNESWETHPFDRFLTYLTLNTRIDYSRTFICTFEYCLVNRAMRDTSHVSLLSLTPRIPSPAESMNDVKDEGERGKGCTYSEMKRAARHTEWSVNHQHCSNCVIAYGFVWFWFQ